MDGVRKKLVVAEPIGGVRMVAGLRLREELRSRIRTIWAFSGERRQILQGLGSYDDRDQLWGS